MMWLAMETWATKTEALQSPWLYLGLVGFVVALILGLGLMVIIKRWLRDQPKSPSPAEQLSAFQLLHLQGDLTQEELDQIRSVFDRQNSTGGELPPPQESSPDKNNFSSSDNEEENS